MAKIRSIYKKKKKKKKQQINKSTKKFFFYFNEQHWTWDVERALSAWLRPCACERWGQTLAIEVRRGRAEQWKLQWYPRDRDDGTPPRTDRRQGQRRAHWFSPHAAERKAVPWHLSSKPLPDLQCTPSRINKPEKKNNIKIMPLSLFLWYMSWQNTCWTIFFFFLLYR